MVIAAGTDYAIFLIGRYQEARGAGEDREQSYYSMFHGTAHVVLGSGLTIAGAMVCLSFTRLPYFQTLGVPCAVGTLVAVLAALTLGPAVVVIGSRFGALRTEARHQLAGLAPSGHRGRSVARSDPGRDDRVGAGRSTRASQLQDELRQPGVPTRRHSCQRRLRRGGTALRRRPDEPRAADDRKRPRPAQLGRLPGHRQDRQGHLPHARHLPGADDHPARRQADQALDDSVPAQHAGNHVRS